MSEDKTIEGIKKQIFEAVSEVRQRSYRNQQEYDIGFYDFRKIDLINLGLNLSSRFDIDLNFENRKESDFLTVDKLVNMIICLKEGRPLPIAHKNSFLNRLLNKVVSRKERES